MIDVRDIAAALKRGEYVEFPPLTPPTPYQPYPRWKYHATRDAVLVGNEAEEARLGEEWGNSPEEARIIRDRLEEATADAAAVRAWDDRHLSDKARAELRRFEQDADGHVLDLPRKLIHK